MSGRRILLWRHGRTEWNLISRFQGQTDIDLDDVGVAQAERTAALLARLRPDALVSSDLRRARATAGALARRTGLPVITDPALRELWASSWQGMTSAEIAERFPEDRAAWRRGEDVRPGGDGETRSEVGARFADAVRRHVASVPDGGLLVVATHGGAAKAGLLTLLGVPRKQWEILSGLSNCHWSLVEEVDGGHWQLQEHNAGSLPQAVVGDES